MLIYIKLSKYLVYSFFLLLGVLSFNSRRFASRYDYIKQENVWKDFAKEISKNLTINNAVSCDYTSILDDDSRMELDSISNSNLDTSNLKLGGEYVPANCKPAFSTAVIVPYRDRDRQLKDFLTYIHTFLGKQNIHYRIYVVEQDDGKPFNRAKLLNIGSVVAIQHGFPCLVLHDVDLLPLKPKNLYACTKSPRHMSASIDKHRFNLPYKELFGGAVSLLSEQFVAANGMSNRYFGWGGEDDDLYERLREISLTPVRLEPEVSAYTMMKHQQQPPSPERKALLAQASLRYAVDGLNSLKFIEKSTKLHPLFTHIIVQL